MRIPVCAAKRQTRREAGAQSLWAFQVWEVAGLPNRAAGHHQHSALMRKGGTHLTFTSSIADVLRQYGVGVSIVS
jgi:hypothetical protein